MPAGLNLSQEIPGQLVSIPGSVVPYRTPPPSDYLPSSQALRDSAEYIGKGNSTGGGYSDGVTGYNATQQVYNGRNPMESRYEPQPLNIGNTPSESVQMPSVGAQVRSSIAQAAAQALGDGIYRGTAGLQADAVSSLADVIRAAIGKPPLTEEQKSNFKNDYENRLNPDGSASAAGIPSGTPQTFRSPIGTPAGMPWAEPPQGLNLPRQPLNLPRQPLDLPRPPEAQPLNLPENRPSATPLNPADPKRPNQPKPNQPNTNIPPSLRPPSASPGSSDYLFPPPSDGQPFPFSVAIFWDVVVFNNDVLERPVLRRVIGQKSPNPGDYFVQIGIPISINQSRTLEGTYQQQRPDLSYVEASIFVYRFTLTWSDPSGAIHRNLLTTAQEDFGSTPENFQIAYQGQTRSGPSPNSTNPPPLPRNYAPPQIQSTPPIGLFALPQPKPNNPLLLDPFAEQRNQNQNQNQPVPLPFVLPLPSAMVSPNPGISGNPETAQPGPQHDPQGNLNPGWQPNMELNPKTGIPEIVIRPGDRTTPISTMTDITPAAAAPRINVNDPLTAGERNYASPVVQNPTDSKGRLDTNKKEEIQTKAQPEAEVKQRVPTAPSPNCEDPCVADIQNKLKTKEEKDKEELAKIKIKVFKACKTTPQNDDDIAEFESETLQVGKSDVAHVKFLFDRLFEIEKEKCRSRFEIPETIALKVPDGRPVLKICYREIGSQGKQKSSKWTVKIPYYSSGQQGVPKASYLHGSTQVRYHFKDGSRIVINAKNETEGKRMVKALLQTVDASKRKGGKFYVAKSFSDSGEDNGMKETKLFPVSASYYSKGTGIVNGLPAIADWNLKLTK